MKLMLTDIRLPVTCGLDELKERSSKLLGVRTSEFQKFKIVKEAIDARKKPDVSRVYSVFAEIPKACRYKKSRHVREVAEEKNEPIVPGHKKLDARPVIVGSGPAGIFAALTLASQGYRPLVLERGQSVEKRDAVIKSYWDTGVLDTECNVQFGEGGAGTFSDGKLTTRINDRRCEKVLQQFYEAGASEDILYKAKPHIGSDVLRTVVANMRARLIEMGGEIRFGAKVTSLIIKGGRAVGVVVNGDTEIEAGVVVLAIGHSARDTFSSLLKSGVNMVQKPFSIGVRIEHPQKMINLVQYGSEEIAALLGAADYQLFCRTGDRTAYTFCMCPGGVVVAAASEKDTIVTNGMSYYARDGENANSAFVVSIGPEDFGSSHALAGVEFQREWEKRAFILGGGNGAAPVQRLEDFVSGRVTTALGSVKPSYTGKTSFADLNCCLPGFVTSSMKTAIPVFDKKLKGFGLKDAVLTGVETRTSSPVRITRGATLEAEGISGLYPAGEGAGYAGGIVSAAVDGIRIAEQIIMTYSPL